MNLAASLLSGVLLSAALAFAGRTAFAERDDDEAPGTLNTSRCGQVSIPRILRLSRQSQQARSRISAEFAPRDRQLRARRQRNDELLAEHRTTVADGDDDPKAPVIRRLLQERKAIDRDRAAFQEALGARTAAAMDSLRSFIERAVAEVAQSRGLEHVEIEQDGRLSIAPYQTRTWVAGTPCTSRVVLTDRVILHMQEMDGALDADAASFGKVTARRGAGQTVLLYAGAVKPLSDVYVLERNELTVRKINGKPIPVSGAFYVFTPGRYRLEVESFSGSISRDTGMATMASATITLDINAKRGRAGKLQSRADGRLIQVRVIPGNAVQFGDRTMVY